MNEIAYNKEISEIGSVIENREAIEQTDTQRLQELLEETPEFYYDSLEQPEILTDIETTKKIADYLETVDELKFESWSKLSLKQKKEILNKIEQNVAAIEHRPALRVEIEEMKPRTLGYQSASENKIALNSLYVGSNSRSVHREVIDTIIHEGRHAYQHYNVDVKLVHESGAEVETWRENFYDPRYQYYHSTGHKIYIPYNDGSIHDVDFRLYYYQPVEIDARNFAKDVMALLEEKGVVEKSDGSEEAKSNMLSDENAQESKTVSNTNDSTINLTDEEINNSRFIIKMGEIGKIDPLDEVIGHVKGYHIIDWKDTINFAPREVESDIRVYRDHNTNKLYIMDSLGFKTELHRTTPEQEKNTGFKYTYESFSHDTIALKDTSTFILSEKDKLTAVNELQTYGLSEKEAKELIAKDSDKAMILINKFRNADASINDMKQLLMGNSLLFNEHVSEKSISFEGNAEDRLNREASRFQDELKREHVYISGSIYLSDIWGGFDQYTTNKIKDAINNARSNNRISDNTYQRLMDDLKKASHYAQ